MRNRQIHHPCQLRKPWRPSVSSVSSCSNSGAYNFGARNLAGVAGHARRFNNKQKKGNKV
jgi:hypothetical protein